MEAKETVPPFVKEATGADVVEEGFLPVRFEVEEPVPRGRGVVEGEVVSTTIPPSEVDDATMIGTSVDEDDEPVIIAKDAVVLDGEDAALVDVASAMKLGEYVPVPS